MNAQIEQFLALARSYVGTPYRHEGRWPGLGFDCAGPFIVAARTVALLPTEYDYLGYPEDPSARLYQDFFEDFPRYMQEVPPPVRRGDVILMRLLHRAKHVAIVESVRPLRLIHAMPTQGVVLHEAGQHWESRIVNIFRFRESTWLE